MVFISTVGETAAAGAAAWWSQPWKAMADLAEAVDDLICSFDYMDTAMDNLVMLVFIWVVVSIALLGLAKWAYSRFKTPDDKADKVDKKPIEDTKKSTANEIIVSADSVLATSAKVKSGALNAKPPTKPSGFVPATPPNKRRMGRMSPGPEQLTSLKKHQSLVVPTCTGPDPPSVQWVNELLTWLYNDLVIVNELVQQWIVSMNEFSKKSVEEQGIGVELVRALDAHHPTISNVFCECDSKDDVTITCDCEATPAFQLKAFSQRGEKVEVSHFRVNVNRFRARINIVVITDKLTGELKCDGWPEVKVALAPVGPLKPTSQNDGGNLQGIISDIVVCALRNTRLEFNLAQYPTCPRLRRYMDSGPRLPLHYDSMLQQDRDRYMYTSTPTSMSGSSVAQLLGDKRLLVKVVSAKDIGGKSGCSAPYCVVEMDEPPQKNQTAFKKDTTSPQWEEHFLFDLSPQTAELLFEVYDRTGPPSPGGGAGSHRFLGLGLVGIDELLAAPSQRQQIALQTRPMEEHDVSGVLTVEFLFIEGADIPDLGSRPFKIKESLRTVSPQGHLTTINKTIFKQNGHENSQLTESALRELEASANSAASKSTLIIHSVQREPRKYIKVELTNSGKFIEVEREENGKSDASAIIKVDEETKPDGVDSPPDCPIQIVELKNPANGKIIGDTYGKVELTSFGKHNELEPVENGKRDASAINRTAQQISHGTVNTPPGSPRQFVDLNIRGNGHGIGGKIIVKVELASWINGIENGKREASDINKIYEERKLEGATALPQRDVEQEERQINNALALNKIEEETELQTQPENSKAVRITEVGNGPKTNSDLNGKQGDYHVNQNETPEPTPRKRKRDFFGTIKRRLGRSRTRGQSLDPHDSETDSQSHLRSISAERNNQDKALSVPNRNVYSAGASPAQSGDDSRTSRRSSLSEFSGFSTASARTFIHEASTLVLETIEAGIKKHYLVPLAIAQRSRWRRKGIKLHIYNEHTFVARHLSGGTVCVVCEKTIARRLGKQGYECRDCQLKCHKHCHVKVPGTCPQSSVRNMELTPTSTLENNNIRIMK